MIKVGIANTRGIHFLQRGGVLQQDPAYDSNRDTTLVASLHDQPIALLHARPVVWTHGFTTIDGISHRLATRAAEALLNYSFGWAPASPRLLHGSIFQVNRQNGNMVSIARSMGAVEQQDSIIYRLDL